MPDFLHRPIPYQAEMGHSYYPTGNKKTTLSESQNVISREKKENHGSKAIQSAAFCEWEKK